MPNLPILWELFPDHPQLLQTEFECSDTLKTKGYVQKPIVGRCGANIAIINSGTTLAETQGQFHTQDIIYQELFPLPQLDNKYIQICSFTVGGKYAGACTRTDPSMIVTSESDILPLRIIDSDTLV